MKTEEEIKEQINSQKLRINEIVKSIENETPKELYSYLAEVNNCKGIIAILEWVLEEE